MKNIQICVTDRRSIVVRADTERFGKNQIMFEGNKFMECCMYIRRVTQKDNFQLKSLSGIPVFTDTEGRTMPIIQEVCFPE